MKAKRISQRAVSECVYTSRLYYNKDLQSDNEKIEYLVYSQPYRSCQIRAGVIYGKCLTPTPPLQPTVNKKPKPIANKFTTIQPILPTTRAAPCQL